MHGPGFVLPCRAVVFEIPDYLFLFGVNTYNRIPLLCELLARPAYVAELLIAQSAFFRRLVP